MSISRLYFVLFYQRILPVFVWGPIGHSLVARLAQSQLSSSTNNWIYNYIPWNFSGNLSAIASWPDFILYPDTNPIDYINWEWSRELHFINIPDWKCEYIRTRDCLNNRCIEGALNNYSKRLVDNNCDYIQRQEALFFLVHFVGDVHQPLHCGFKGDSGGNNIKGKRVLFFIFSLNLILNLCLGFFLNEQNLTNLHTIWDVEIINSHLHLHFQSDLNLYYEHLLSLMLNQTSISNESYNDYKKWIDESIDYVCQQICLDDSNIKLNISVNFTLGEHYFTRSWPVIDQRLAQGGRRLASLLNRLAENRSLNKFPSDMQVFIIVLSIDVGVGVLVAFVIYLFKRRNNKK